MYARAAKRAGVKRAVPRAGAANAARWAAPPAAAPPADSAAPAGERGYNMFSLYRCVACCPLFTNGMCTTPVEITVRPLPRDVPPKLGEVDSAAFSEDLQGEPDPFSPSFRVFCTHCKATFDMMLAFRR